MEVKAFGVNRSEVMVNPIDVLTQLKEQIIPHGYYVKENEDEYILMDIGGNHRVDVKIGTISKEEYEYVTHISKALKYLYMKHDEEIKLKREFEAYKQNKSSN